MVDIVLNRQMLPEKSAQPENSRVFELLAEERVRPVGDFLRRLGHRPTPLADLPALAAELGLGGLMVKDESGFMGLGSFKARGSLWAMANILGVNLPDDPVAAARATAEPRLFVTATDGNHGKGVAWAARLFGQTAHIFMPRGSSGAIVDAVRDLGAKCEILDKNYDDTVRQAADFAMRQNGVLIQDTAWPVYEDIPALIMQGYGSMGAEIISGMGDFWPDYVLLQIGVGSFAAAIMAYMIQESMRQGLDPPGFIGLEPKNAACVFKSLQSGDGLPQAVKGNLESEMRGLCCGEVSSLAWPILRNNLFACCACSDDLARSGMRILARAGDSHISSGPSGAIGAGFLAYARQDDNLRHLIGAGSRVLLISTEGNPDAM